MYLYSDILINITLKHLSLFFPALIANMCFHFLMSVTFYLLPYSSVMLVCHIWGRRDRGREGEDACRPMEGLRLRHHSGPSGAILRA